MPRQTSKRSALPLERARDPASALILRKSPARLKLEAQEKAHERLLREIERKKLGCEAAEHLLRDVQDTLYVETQPLRASMSSRVREIDQIFSELLGRKSRFGRSERAELKRFYQQVLGGLPRPEGCEADAEEPRARAGEGSAGGPRPPFGP